MISCGQAVPRRRLLRALATLHSVDAAREAGGVAAERLRGEMSASAPLDPVILCLHSACHFDDRGPL